MKKFFYTLLMLAPFALLMPACDDDNDDAPDVSINAQIEGGVFSDGEIYVPVGSDLDIVALTLTNNTNKQGALGAVTYYWDNAIIGTALVAPYSLKIETSQLEPSRHLLRATMPVYVVDYPICTGYIQYYVNIVNPEDMPSDTGENTVSGVVQTKD